MVMISDKVIEMATKNETDANNKKAILERIKMLKKKVLRLEKVTKIKEETLKKVNQYSTDWLADHEVKKIIYCSLLILCISGIL